MALPDDLNKIRTNLSKSELIDIIKAIENGDILWGEGSLYHGSRLETFSYKGYQYDLSEWFEEVSSIYRNEN